MHVTDFDFVRPVGVFSSHVSTAGGSEVGEWALSLSPTIGYRAVKFMVRAYLDHRSIWQLLNRPIPEHLVIDHIHDVRSDNRIENSTSSLAH